MMLAVNTLVRSVQLFFAEKSLFAKQWSQRLISHFAGRNLLLLSCILIDEDFHKDLIGHASVEILCIPPVQQP